MYIYILFWFPYLSVSVCYVVNGLSIPFWWPYPGMLPYRIIFSVCYDVNVCYQYYIHRFSTTLQNIFIKNSVSCKVRVHNSAQHAISPSALVHLCAVTWQHAMTMSQVTDTTYTMLSHSTLTIIPTQTLWQKTISGKGFRLALNFFIFRNCTKVTYQFVHRIKMFLL